MPLPSAEWWASAYPWLTQRRAARSATCCSVRPAIASSTADLFRFGTVPYGSSATSSAGSEATSRLTAATCSPASSLSSAR